MLKISNLNKSFGELKVLKDISFEVSKGEVVAIIGPSGTGKSTLLRCINYLEKPDSGIVEIEGTKYDFLNMNKKDIYDLRKHSCMVFQQYNLFKNKTVIENLTEALHFVQKREKLEAQEIAEKLLKKVGMFEKKDEYPSRLSGGQQQ
ncbi:MAG: amino acid ABC transporter ATP-binding protein, partial [Parvimonas sp.]|nr:amino acid ABC transporter ATP-binding protein [Parvimonas sp.]